VIGDLPNSDFVMNNVFWIGVFPGLTEPMLEFVSATIHAFVSRMIASRVDEGVPQSPGI
jgi:CDP-6-deoxy-D-xylo-4-hexulose-3-dehydrase